MLRRDDDSVLRVGLDLEVSGKRKRRTTKKDLEETSGRGDREDWFEEGGCPETRQVERQSVSSCRRNRVNPALSAQKRQQQITTTTKWIVW